MTKPFGESQTITCVGISCRRSLGTFRCRRRCTTGNGHRLLIDYTYKLLKWTLDKIEPSWAKDDRRRDRRASELGDWRRRFGYFLAKLALELDEDTALTNILKPIFALSDEAAELLINPFVDILAAGGIIDPPRIMPNAINLMKACVDRVLRDHAWQNAAYHEGNIHGHDLPEIVRVFLFATGVRAGSIVALRKR